VNCRLGNDFQMKEMAEMSQRICCYYKISNGFLLQENGNYHRFFNPPTDVQLNCLKNNFKIYIKIDIKTAPTCFAVITTIRERITRSCCFNINFNVSFKIVFKTIQLCISWWIKKTLIVSICCTVCMWKKHWEFFIK
jgi:hypothetical protein